MNFSLDAPNKLKEVAEEYTKQLPKEIEGTWYDENRETILLYGLAKSGKTWAYCSIIKDQIDKGNTIHIINTDGGVTKTLKAYIGENWKEYASKIKYYSVNSINDGVAALTKIKESVKLKDWIILDLISDFWELAQTTFIDDISNNAPESYILSASKDPKKFGVLEGSKWNYCKKLDNSITSSIIRNFKCNILGVASYKDVDVAEKISGKIDTDFHLVKYKPAGQKELSYRFDTLVYVEREQYTLVGDRGNKTAKIEKKKFGKNFWEIFQKEER